MNLNARKTSFDAVTDDRTTIVILGSLPGERSLAMRQYYAQPTNQFWRLMGEVTGAPLPSLAYEQRLATLLGAHVGLWDVVQSATRQGSADGSIRDHRANDLHDLIAAAPHIRALAFNGQAAAKIGRKQLAGQGHIALIDLPSSSAAYCTLSFDQKLAQWRIIADHLG